MLLLRTMGVEVDRGNRAVHQGPIPPLRIPGAGIQWVPTKQEIFANDRAYILE